MSDKTIACDGCGKLIVERNGGITYGNYAGIELKHCDNCVENRNKTEWRLRASILEYSLRESFSALIEDASLFERILSGCRDIDSKTDHEKIIKDISRQSTASTPEVAFEYYEKLIRTKHEKDKSRT